MTETIKTRFAPSPSGYLHLGGARTALFAWAFARRGGGEFLLRIEDTDAARSDDRHSRAIAESLQWLGLQFDGEIAYQSRRRARHLEIAAQLSRGDDVFEDGGALRLRTPDEGETAFDDLVCGRLAVQNRELENPVLVRADKTPTYIFASAADDMDGGITHVIRGDDHIRNTHKQLHLYRALQKAPPHFAHLPMILGGDGARLSKRNAAVDVLHYRREGFLSRALMNYLARLSWSHGDAEKFDSDFLIRNFDFAKVSRSPAKFDLAKLKWLNGEYLRELPPNGNTACEVGGVAAAFGKGGGADFAAMRDAVGVARGRRLFCWPPEAAAGIAVGASDRQQSRRPARFANRPRRPAGGGMDGGDNQSRPKNHGAKARPKIPPFGDAPADSSNRQRANPRHRASGGGVGERRGDGADGLLRVFLIIIQVGLPFAVHAVRNYLFG